MHVDYVISISDLPRECIEDCHHSGSCDADVAHWLKELSFTVDRNRAVRCLTGYGLGDDDEPVSSWDDERLAAYVLWLACGDFSEYITQCEDEGIDPFGERPEDFEPNCGSDLFCLE